MTTPGWDWDTETLVDLFDNVESLYNLYFNHEWFTAESAEELVRDHANDYYNLHAGGIDLDKVDWEKVAEFWNQEKDDVAYTNPKTYPDESDDYPLLQAEVSDDAEVLYDPDESLYHKKTYPDSLAEYHQDRQRALYDYHVGYQSKEYFDLDDHKYDE